MSARGHMPGSRQAGVVLFITMIILLVLSLLGAMAAHSAIAEYRMAGSERDRQLAHIATESALGEARSKILQAAAAFGAEQVCAHLSCMSRDAAAPVDALSFMQSAAAKAAANAFHVDLANLSGADASARLATNSHYVIEDLGLDPSLDGNAVEQSAAQEAAANMPATNKSATNTSATNPSATNKTRFFHVTASAVGGTGQYVEADEVVYGVIQ
jgi:Tfp pilus assembly protein PilX